MTCTVLHNFNVFRIFFTKGAYFKEKPKVKQSVSMPIRIQITLAQSVLLKFYRKRHFKVLGRLFTYIVSLGKNSSSPSVFDKP